MYLDNCEPDPSMIFFFLSSPSYLSFYHSILYFFLSLSFVFDFQYLHVAGHL